MYSFGQLHRIGVLFHLLSTRRYNLLHNYNASLRPNINEKFEVNCFHWISLLRENSFRNLDKHAIICFQRFVNLKKVLGTCVSNNTEYFVNNCQDSYLKNCHRSLTTFRQAFHVLQHLTFFLSDKILDEKII